MQRLLQKGLEGIKGDGLIETCYKAVALHSPASARVLIRKIRRLSPDLNYIQLLDFSQTEHRGLIWSLQIRSELEQLLESYSKGERPRFIMEIGTCKGGTLFPFTRLASNDATIISLDLPGGKYGGGYPKWKVPLYQSFTRLEQKMHLVRENSHTQETLAQITSLLGANRLDFLFIDGDHTYEGVKQDFEMYSPLVRPGGTVAFHDIAASTDPSCTVAKFWNEIKQRYSFQEFIADKNQGWAGIGVLTIPAAKK